MQRKYVMALLVGFLITLLPFRSGAWGIWGHHKINQQAVFTLPPQMLRFYKANLDFLIKQSTAPDQRRNIDPFEAPRHFIDVDHYGKYPFVEVPRAYQDAAARLTADTLNKYGTVPWTIQLVLFKLSEAFRNRDARQILILSGDLGHYVADAHVPLHSTQNYDGQLTGQKGIHALWESRLPELYGDSYNYYVGPAVYQAHPLAETWVTVLESAAALDTALSVEKTLEGQFPEDQRYTFEKRGSRTIRQYSEAYAKAYHEHLHGQVEQRMRKAIARLGSLWFTAWVNAGQPDLDHLDQPATPYATDSLPSYYTPVPGHENGSLVPRQQGSQTPTLLRSLTWEADIKSRWKPA